MPRSVVPAQVVERPLRRNPTDQSGSLLPVVSSPVSNHSPKDQVFVRGQAGQGIQRVGH